MTQRNLRDGRPVFVAAETVVKLTPVPLEAKGADGISEASLQKLMFDHPDVLPVSEIEGAIEGLISVCCELPTPNGYVDNLFITPDGHVVLAEAKLWRNPQARRQVVAQALDYASCLARFSYSNFEAAALLARKKSGLVNESLWSIVPEHLRLPEAHFIDRVAGNLRNGRILILVVGDGIRSDAEQLVDLLQSHAGAHFTFALVELAVFAIPGGDVRLVMPRTLVRTQLVERGVVRVEGDSVSVQPIPTTSTTPGTRTFAGGISTEEFFDAMRARDPALPGELKRFLEQLTLLGVYPDFRRALNLKWDAPDGRTVNLAIIQRDGQVWTSESGAGSSEELGRAYNEALAQAWGGAVASMRWGEGLKWQARLNGKVPKIEQVRGKLDAWVEVLGRHLPKVAEAA